MTADSGDALASTERMHHIAGCGILDAERRRHTFATDHARKCERCASLLVAAIAAQVERETKERCAIIFDGRDDEAAAYVRALDPRYGGNPT